MKYPESEYMRQIRQGIEEERRKSRFRNRCSYFERKHPLQHDADMLSDFCISRRLSRPGAWEALKRAAGNSVDTEALRYLVVLVLEGSTYRAMRKCCARILETCAIYDKALARLADLKARCLRGEPLSDEENKLLREQLSPEDQQRFDAELNKKETK